MQIKKGKLFYNVCMSQFRSLVCGFWVLLWCIQFEKLGKRVCGFGFGGFGGGEKSFVRKQKTNSNIFF